MATANKDHPFVYNYSNSTCYNFDNSATAIISQLLMASFILFLNCMVVSVMWRNRRKAFRKPAYIFIVALATTDILLAICLICFSSVSIANLQLTTNAWVNLTASTSICFNASVNFLLVIALDRLCFIAYNRSYNFFMRHRIVVFQIVLCWVVGMLPVLPLFFWNVGSCAEHCVCSTGQFLTCAHSSCSSVVKGFTKRLLFGMFFYFLTMFVSILTIYAMLFVKVHHQAKRVRHCLSESSGNGRNARMRREFRLLRTLSLVVITFFVCWSPLMILYVVDFASSNGFIISTIASQTILTLAILNSMLNPIIYAARIPILKNYFCICSCGNKRNTSVSRKHKSSGSSSRKSLPQNINTQSNSNCGANHIYKGYRFSSSSTHLANQAKKNNPCTENALRRERMNSWPSSTPDHSSMTRTSSTFSSQRFKVNYSCGAQTSKLNRKPLLNSATLSKRNFNESSIVEEICHLAENC